MWIFLRDFEILYFFGATGNLFSIFNFSTISEIGCNLIDLVIRIQLTPRQLLAFEAMTGNIQPGQP